MRAAHLHKFGAPLVIEDAPRPSPGPDEVLIEVEACGVCHSDLHLASGDWPSFAKSIHWPLVLGHEVVGRVAQIGAGVDTRVIGTRVGVGWVYSSCGACDNCRDDRENICQNRGITSVTSNGGFAEFMLAKANYALPIPRELSPQEAAPLLRRSHRLSRAAQCRGGTGRARGRLRHRRLRPSRRTSGARDGRGSDRGGRG